MIFVFEYQIFRRKYTTIRPSQVWALVGFSVRGKHFQFPKIVQLDNHLKIKAGKIVAKAHKKVSSIYLINPKIDSSYGNITYYWTTNKIWVILLIAYCLSLVFAYCGNRNTQSPQNRSNFLGSKLELTFSL